MAVQSAPKDEASPESLLETAVGAGGAFAGAKLIVDFLKGDTPASKAAAASLGLNFLKSAGRGVQISVGGFFVGLGLGVSFYSLRYLLFQGRMDSKFRYYRTICSQQNHTSEDIRKLNQYSFYINNQGYKPWHSLGCSRRIESSPFVFWGKKFSETSPPAPAVLDNVETTLANLLKTPQHNQHIHWPGIIEDFFLLGIAGVITGLGIFILK